MLKSLHKGGHDIIADVLVQSNADIDILDYDETEGETTITLPLLPAMKNLIRALQAFVRYKHSTGNPIDDLGFKFGMDFELKFSSTGEVVSFVVCMI